MIKLATAPQRQFIAEMTTEIAWEVDDGYARWLGRSLGLVPVRTRDDANRVIEGLRGLKAHGHSRPRAAYSTVWPSVRDANRESAALVPKGDPTCCHGMIR